MGITDTALDSQTSGATDNDQPQLNAAGEPATLEDTVNEAAHQQGPVVAPKQEEPKTLDEALGRVDQEKPAKQEPKTLDDALVSLDKERETPFFSIPPIPQISYQDEVARSNAAMKEFLSGNPVGRIASAMGYELKEDVPTDLRSYELSDEDRQDMVSHGFFSDYAKGEDDWKKNITEAFIQTAAIGVHALVTPFMAGFGALGAGLTQAGKELGPTIGAPLQAAGEIATGVKYGYGMGGEFAGAVPHESAVAIPVPHDVAAAGEAGAIGAREGVYMGTEDPSPQEAGRMRQSSQMAAMYGEQAELPKTPDINEYVRSTAPDTFKEYDAVNAQKDIIRSQISSLSAERENQFQMAREAIAKKYEPEIEDLQAKVDDAQKRGKSSVYEDILRNKIAQRDEEISKIAAQGDTPEMADLRGKLMKMDERARDLAPAVSAAYKEAQSKFTPSVTQPIEMGAKEQETPAEVQQPQVNLRDNIIKDFTDTAIKAGRPEDEARAVATLVAEHYQARSERFGGEKGNAEEMYRSEIPELRNTISKNNTKELAQSAAEKNKQDFKNSKVVDAQGNLQTVYHGTQDSISKFDLNHPNRKDNGWLGEAVYATSEANLGGSYANLKSIGNAGPNIMPLHMNIENPFEIKGTMEGANLKNRLRFASKEEIRAFTQDLKNKGYDGVIWTLDDGTKEFAAFNEGSVRSAVSGEDLFQRTQGGIQLATDTARAAINLFKTANASTLIHEMAHHWLDELVRDAQDEAAPYDVAADAATVREWLGAKTGDFSGYTRAQHEKFARGFERYMREGVAPSSTLARVFEQFKTWLTQIYKTVSELRSPITDDVRKVFDNLLTTDKKETVIAPEHAPGEHLAVIHEQDAREATPANAGETWDTVRQEADALTKLYDPEIFDELTRENGEQSATPAENTTTGTATEPTTGAGTTIEEPGAVNAGGDESGAKGPAVREQPSAGSGNADRGDRGTGKETERPGRFIKEDGDIDKDALNYALYNNTPDWLQNFFNEYAERNQGTYNDPTGGVETLESMQKLVESSGWTPKEIRNMEIGQKRNRLQQLASAQLFKQVVDDVREQATKALSGSPEDIAKFYESTQEHSMLMQLFRDQQAYSAEASRNLGIRRAIAGVTGDAKQFAQLFQQITEKSPTDLKQQAKYLEQLVYKGQAEKFLKDGSQTPWQKFRNGMLEYYINALISGPITHFRYSVGNAINALMTPLVELPVAATIGAIRGDPDRVYFGEIGAQIMALGKGSRDGLTAAVTAFKTGNSPALPGEAVSDMFLQKQKQGYAIPGVAGEVINLPARSVAAIHSQFKSIRYEQELQGLAWRIASREGLTGEAHTNRFSDLCTNPTEEMMQYATKKALRELFMSPSEYGTTVGSLNRVINNNMALKLIVPFMKIGSQITRNAFMDRTPLGLLAKDIRDNALGRNGNAESDLAVGKMVVGSAIVGTMITATLEGNATGDGPEDPKERAVWLLNHRPNSLKVGSITIPYQGLGPIGMLMRFSANMTEAGQHIDHENLLTVAREMLQGFSKSVMDENFMRGMKDMLDAMYHPDEYGETYLRSFATNWLPFSVGQSQVAHKIDPFMRDVNTHGSVLQQIIDTARSKTPFLSEGLKPKRDRFGEPIPNGELLPQYQNDPVVQRMEKLQMGISPLERKMLGVPLTDQQYDDYSRVAGRLAKQHLDRLIGNSGFSQLADGTQMVLINKTITQAREEARVITIMDPSHPENRDIIRQAVLKKREALTGKNTSQSP